MRDTKFLRSSEHPRDSHPSFLAVEMPQGGPDSQASLAPIPASAPRARAGAWVGQADWSLMLVVGRGFRGISSIGVLAPFISCVSLGKQLDLSPVSPAFPPSPARPAMTGRIIIIIMTSSWGCFENSLTRSMKCA